MQHSLAWRSRMGLNSGLRIFLIVWVGQLVSILGSGLTGFALGLWVYQRTGSVTAYSMMALASTLPHVLFAPLAGIAADSYDRRKLMILSDFGAGISTLLVALLMWTGRLEPWHLYLAAAAGAVFGSFQWPAYSAATTQLVPVEHLGRVNGLVGIGRAATGVLAPALAGLLVLWIGVPGVMLVDFGTFLLAVGTLLVVRFPPLIHTDRGKEKQQSPRKHALVDDMLFGWRYVLAQPGLFILLLFVMLFNFIWSMVSALAAPLVLNFATPQVLGLFITVAGTGMFAGSLVMGAWGGPKRRILGVIGFELISGFCFILMGLRPEFWRVALGAFGAHFTIAFIDGSNKSIWQKKIPQEFQGRVFAVWQMVALAAAPLAFLSAGPLADRVFEPLMRSGDPLFAGLNGLVGSGQGRGIGLMFVLMGLIKILAALACAIPKTVRNVERS